MSDPVPEPTPLPSPVPPPLSPPPAAEMNSRTYATLMHLSAFSGFVIPSLSLFAPLVMWVIRKDRDPFVDSNGRNILNFQLSCLIYAVLFIPLCFILFGFAFLGALALFNLVCNVIGASRANDGISWKYPLAISFFKV